ncbi:MAG TPA: secretin N-terminal domain-containing protein [Rariglobus sp.]|nr:secretin N-terminal domain-containing protein [Rariglobus sp.]
MRLPRPFFIAGLCLAPAVLVAQIPQTVSTTTVPAVRAPEEIIDSLRLRDAPLDLVIDRLEVWTGRIVLRPQALPATAITLNIPKPVPKSEAIQALVSALALNNIGVVEMGDKYLKIVELANKTRTEAPELITGSLIGLPPSGRTASKVFELNNLKAQDFVPQLNTLLNVQLGGAVLFNNTNSFLVTDSISNLQRVEQLLLALDLPASTNFTPKFYTLRFAKASDLVSRVKQMLQGPNQQALGTTLSLSADDRTNQAVLIADPRQHPFFDELISKLDVKADPNTRTEVIKLNNATAADVATLLTTVITGQTTAAAKASGSTSRTNSGNTSPFNPTPAPTPAAPAANNNAAAARPASTTSAAALASESATQFSSLLTVTSDLRSNSVVVSGTLDDIRLIRELVDKIDIVLAQVRIEVVIAEVTLSDTKKSGLQELNLTVGPDPTGTTQITNFSGAVSGWTVTNGTVNPIAFQNVMTNTGQKNNLKVLSSPTIVTAHNNEAQIIVGESRPIITGSTSTPNSGTGGGTTTSSTVTYKDIAIDLKVTPLIGESGNIQLKIDQQVNDIVDNVTIDGNEQPVIGRRQAISFINVLDGQMVVLGGLQRTKNIKNRTRLGIFFEIPGISQLLGARTKTEERTELLLFIRPHVLSPEIGTAQAQTEINRLSNKDQINTHIANTPFNPPPPAPEPEEKPDAPVKKKR